MANKTGYRRRSIRIIDFPYTYPGPYFITICTHENKSILGKIINGKMKLNKLGEIVREEWYRSEKIRPGIQLDAFVVMPNHVHGIVLFPDIDSSSVGAHSCAPLRRKEDEGTVGAHSCAPLRRQPRSLGTFIAQFKSTATKRINEYRNSPGSPVWQRNYYEHVIRDEKSLEKIREYIVYNPQGWDVDGENPKRDGEDPFDHWLSGFKQRPNA